MFYFSEYPVKRFAPRPGLATAADDRGPGQGGADRTERRLRWPPRSLTGGAIMSASQKKKNTNAARAGSRTRVY